jgi:predicted DNA-binding transcriptional regulator YafY
VERKRLVPDRFRRLWTLAEFIAQQPGANRPQLAERFALSERQLQSDLVILRDDFGLPLTRRDGYHFQSSAPATGLMTVGDVATLAAIAQRAWDDPAVSRDALESLAASLPQSFPAHLQALARRALQPHDHGLTPSATVFTALLSAIAHRRAVQLQYAPQSHPTSADELLMVPEVMLPYRHSWYLIGRPVQSTRLVMICVDGAESVELA